MNTFMNEMNKSANYGLTQNGGLAHKSTGEALYDMFAHAGAMRNRRDEDCILLFKNAFDENPVYALKCLFYERDIRGGGQGERRYFRVCYRWLIGYNKNAAKYNLGFIPEYGRWDDLLYITQGTKLWNDAMKIVKHQLALDMECKTPSLLAKWLPSENASAAKTIALARDVRNYLGMTSRQYRKVLSILRERIKVLEKLMSANRWDEIADMFDKIPSRAGLIYKNAFARRDILKAKYEAFIKDETKKVNAATLYPYDVVKKALDLVHMDRYGRFVKAADYDSVERLAVNKYWENLPDYFAGKESSMMCVVDTSGSMTWGNPVRPIDVAISLGIYCGERCRGPFQNNYISFASRPQLIKIEGVDFVDKVTRIYRTNLIDNTNLEATFDLLLKIATQPGVRKEDIPKTLVVISDMQIDSARCAYRYSTQKCNTRTMMENMREKWAAYGLTLPKLVYWNVNATGNADILDDGPNVTYVSGSSPTIFKQVMTGKTGIDLMYEILDGERYKVINMA